MNYRTARHFGERIAEVSFVGLFVVPILVARVVDSVLPGISPVWMVIPVSICGATLWIGIVIFCCGLRKSDGDLDAARVASLVNMPFAADELWYSRIGVMRCRVRDLTLKVEVGLTPRNMKLLIIENAATPNVIMLSYQLITSMIQLDAPKFVKIKALVITHAGTEFEFSDFVMGDRSVALLEKQLQQLVRPEIFNGASV
jgi:hypothetical protein